MRGPQRIVLVRHGETVGQSSIRYFGKTDIALSELGRRQMEGVARALAAEEFDCVYTSSLQRTVAAAAIIAPGVRHCRIADFDEIHFGRWEGLTREEIAARDPDLFQSWRRTPAEFAYPEGDAAPAFRGRVGRTLRRLLPEMPPRILVVGHKGVIWTIAAEILHLSPATRAAWPIDLASIHILARDGAGWRAAVVNDTRHLAREEA